MPSQDTVPSNPATPAPPAGAHPSRIGSYCIIRVLAHDGMGLVYEAEQIEPFCRSVALKVIPAAWIRARCWLALRASYLDSSGSVPARFEGRRPFE